jgi:L-malate glycosyltransferase
MSGEPAMTASPLRVCHVMTADLWAGAEVQLATMASHLAARPDVRLSAVLFNEGRLAGELRRLGVDVTVMDEQRTGSLGILAGLSRHFRDHEFDVVHTHRYKDSVLGIVAAKVAGVPHAVRTVHGLREATRGWAWAKEQAYAVLERITLWSLTDAVIAVSRRMAETLAEAECRPETLTQISNGIDLARLRVTRNRDDVRRAMGLEPGDLVIGTAGRLSRVKGHGILLRAARVMVQRERRTRIVVAGDGPLRDELRETARRLHVDGACRFLGARDDVHDVLAALDVFVLPSLDEGIPMVLLEAMALGKPIVASAVGGIPEIVTHGVSGLLVAPDDEQALADACLGLARDPARARALGEEARRVAEARFAHDRNGAAIAAVYQSLAARPPSPARPRGLRVLGRGLARGAVAYARHRLRRAAEWRQLRRRRHDPADLTAALRSARRILIVCHGNIIRSAFAARLVAQALGDGSRVAIASGGLAAVPGRPPHPIAVLTANARRVDLSQHTASRVGSEDVAGADVIFVMDLRQLGVMRTRFPEARARTFLLTGLAPDTPLEVRDPVDGDESRFRVCFDHITRAVRPIVRVLSEAA